MADQSGDCLASSGPDRKVLAFAEAKGWRAEGKNPATWRNGLDAILPQRKRLTRGHHRAMPYQDVPAFLERLKGSVGVAARALEFAMLCAARSGEVVGARWEEVDFAQKVWSVPATRMKAGKEHRVPLSPRAVEILKLMAEVREDDHPYVFPGHKTSKAKKLLTAKPVSAGALEMLLRRMEVKDAATIHGFRSSFRDWAGDQTSFPREVAEAALAHVVGGVEGAYRRGDALAKRRKLMEAWADFLSNSKAKGKVVALALKLG